LSTESRRKRRKVDTKMRTGNARSYSFKSRVSSLRIFLSRSEPFCRLQQACSHSIPSSVALRIICPHYFCIFLRSILFIRRMSVRPEKRRGNKVRRSASASSSFISLSAPYPKIVYPRLRISISRASSYQWPRTLHSPRMQRAAGARSALVIAEYSTTQRRDCLRLARRREQFLRLLPVGGSEPHSREKTNECSPNDPNVPPSRSPTSSYEFS